MFWPSSSSRHSQPSSGGPTIVVDQPEGDAVGCADGQDHEAPEDGGVQQPGVEVAEHPDLDDGVLG